MAKCRWLNQDPRAACGRTARRPTTVPARKSALQRDEGRQSVSKTSCKEKWSGQSTPRTLGAAISHDETRCESLARAKPCEAPAPNTQVHYKRSGISHSCGVAKMIHPFRKKTHKQQHENERNLTKPAIISFTWIGTTREQQRKRKKKHHSETDEARCPRPLETDTKSLKLFTSTKIMPEQKK